MVVWRIKKGNKHGPLQLGVGVVKVVVIGEPGVGKSTFIRAYYQHHEPGEVYSNNGVMVYPCEFMVDGMPKRAEIFEIPGDPEFDRELRIPHYEDADVIVLMYGIDYPLSLKLLTDKWLPEAHDSIFSRAIPVVLVGNKLDLRNNQQVIEALALNDEQPVTHDQGADLFSHVEIRGFCEISALNVQEVDEVFGIVFDFSVD